ncbi:MAG: type II secretion system major pseudopilin GspG [Phycisphaerales bacterium]|nr:type II secretion system major pseudopilin GspG [Phycisphaerales bacterium]
MRSTRRTRRGFTLLELLVVLGILALLATLVAPKVLGQLGKAKPQVTVQQIQNAKTAIQSFQLDVGRFPTTEEGLEILITKREGAANMDKWKGPYFERKSLPVDGWGNPLRYRAPAREPGFEFEIYSLGADNAEGGEGENADIFSWQ